MKNERQIIEVGRETFHILLNALILVPIRAGATRRKPKVNVLLVANEAYFLDTKQKPYGNIQVVLCLFI